MRAAVSDDDDRRPGRLLDQWSRHTGMGAGDVLLTMCRRRG
jgi:hypothetical protein